MKIPESDKGNSRSREWWGLPLICNQHSGVSTIGDATIPENTIVGKLNLITVVLLRALAELTLQTWCRQASYSYPVPCFEPCHVGSYLGDNPSNFMPECHIFNSKNHESYGYIHTYRERGERVLYGELPGDNRIHGDAPVIPDMVEISVAYPTVQDFNGNIIGAVFSAIVITNPSVHRLLINCSNWITEKNLLETMHLLLKTYGVILPEESWAAHPETVCVWFGVVWAIYLCMERKNRGLRCGFTLFFELVPFWGNLDAILIWAVMKLGPCGRSKFYSAPVLATSSLWSDWITTPPAQ